MVVRWIALLVLAMAVSAPAAAAERKAVRVGVDAVREEPLAQTVPVLGRLVPMRAGQVAARTAGPVTRIWVEVGDRVEAGQVLAILDVERARLDKRLREAEVVQAESAKRTAVAQTALLRQELKRLGDLRKSAAFSQARYEDKKRELDRALSEVAEADASIARSRAALARAEVDILDGEVRAPYAGVVSDRLTELGAWVDSGDPVVSLIDDRHLEIEADVPSGRVAGLTPDRPVRFDLSRSGSHTATVRAVVPEENPLTRTRVVRFTPGLPDVDLLGAGDLNLAANQSVTLHIPVGVPRMVVTVHKDALIDRQGRRIVFLVAEGKAEQRAVSVGEAVGTRFVVTDGLNVGDLAVTRGNERLRPGQAVTAPAVGD